MNAFFLGGPLHGKTLEDPQKAVYRYRKQLREKIQSRGGWKPAAFDDVVVYHRYGKAAVYVAEGYESTPDDEDAVREHLKECEVISREQWFELQALAISECLQENYPGWA